MAEESENFGHEHPLILLNEGEQSNQSEEEAYCSRCGEEVLLSASRFRCVECSGFYLHKKCAEAPSQINHPFHPNHPLLLQNQPYGSGGSICDFCEGECTRFVYHCSCGLDFHIKCALFTYNIAQNNLKELDHVAHEDPSINSTENDDKQLGYHDDCFGCREPLASSVYFSPDCGFNLHKKCAELPLKINHMWHRKHPLFLQFNSELLSCKICQQTRRRGFLYCCSPCGIAVHIQCLSPSPSPIIEGKGHQHPFTLFRRRTPFICDACGTEGVNGVAYLCLACNIMVHEKCTSLPRIIKSRWHHHRIFHTYFLQDENFKSWDCIICLGEVKAEHGSYHCSDCKIIAHVKCATKHKNWYYVVSEENEDEKSSDSLALSPITCVIEWNEAGEATKIEHFKHIHDLTLSNGEIEECYKHCNGCILPISPPYFSCSECDFFLHKACAELPKKKEVWFHTCQRQLLTLISDYIFRCEACKHLSNGFGYQCNECERHVCLRCATLTPGTLKHPGHPHPVCFYIHSEGSCRGCGNDTKWRLPYYCNGCNIALEVKCITLPTTARHKCDTHLLALTYNEDNDYSETHYCDICEERRDPNHWFYHCATCKTSAHVNCVLGEYPFLKLGSIVKDEEYHPHPLTFVKKMYYYPECIKCGQPCQDLALECAESGCDFIACCECIDPRDL